MTKKEKLERQIELLKKFNQEEDYYEEKKIDNKWYIKSFNGGTKRWQVSIFEEDKFKKYKGYNKVQEESRELDEMFNQKVRYDK